MSRSKRGLPGLDSLPTLPKMRVEDVVLRNRAPDVHRVGMEG